MVQTMDMKKWIYWQQVEIPTDDRGKDGLHTGTRALANFGNAFRTCNAPATIRKDYGCVQTDWDVHLPLFSGPIGAQNMRDTRRPQQKCFWSKAAIARDILLDDREKHIPRRMST
ncbi:hypothetical protein HNY73_006173 [Argiope bruennichi]|uniref:Uncharacterized protein n=1 Tax=Argiope bruennichi TaxID=94029 RepID=A0A8T0FLM4_ARGBR|nr:hypothetical protein HNY73_006173 [Argiope bruennichi]